jgi:hypothetical protein
MAKRSKNRRRHGFGSIISVRKGMDGIFDHGTVVGDALPVILGGAVVLGTVFAIRKMMPATASSTAQYISRYAAWVGAAAGSALGLGLVYGMGQRSAGTALIASSLTTAGVLEVSDNLPVAAAVHEAVASASDAAAAVAGFGAIVPQFNGMGAIVPQFGAVMPQFDGLGATVLESWDGARPQSIGGLGAAYGTDVNLSGLGAVNTNAFGTPGFNA